jgi:hypothetical protein
MKYYISLRLFYIHKQPEGVLLEQNTVMNWNKNTSPQQADKLLDLYTALHVFDPVLGY